MARGWHYAKLSLSNARRLSFSGMYVHFAIILVPFSLSFLFVFFSCSHWSLVDVPLISFCPADHVPDWQPRIVLGMVEARSVNVKKTTTTWYIITIRSKGWSFYVLKKYLNASRPSEHPPVRGKNVKTRFFVGGIIGCKYKTSS